MQDEQLIILVAGVAGLMVGVPLARSSHRAEPVRSRVAHIFHYLASVNMAAVPFGVLTGIVVANARSGVLTALAFLALAAILLLIFAVPESFARRNQDELSSNAFSIAWQRWKLVSGKIGDFNGLVILGLFYFTLALPFGVVFRLTSDRLDLKPPAHSESLWIGREQPADPTLTDARRQY